jgi:HSP20 family protein
MAYSLSSWTPARTWQDLDEQFDHVFRGLFPPTLSRAGQSGWTLPLEVVETAEGYTISAEVPGVASEDVKVTLTNDTLRLEGEKKAPTWTAPEGQPAPRVHASERTYGAFTRQLRFPVPLDGEAITAEVKDGLLTVRLPKAREAQPRQIQIQAK